MEETAHLTGRFRVNTPDVVYEIIEGEAVIVNLGNGLYYSVDQAGAVMWELIQNNVSVEQITAILHDRYTGSEEDVANGVATFIEQLTDESLIVVDNSSVVAQPEGRANPPAASSVKPPFEQPVLQRYIDMEDLLLLDPIHNAIAPGDPR